MFSSSSLTPPRLQRWTRGALAAAALALCAPGWAASSGSFTTGPIKFELIDLRPNDGIAPSVSFQTLPGQEGGVAAQGAQLAPMQLELRAQYGSWADTRISAATSLAKAKAQVQGGGSDGVAGGAMMSGNGSAKDVSVPSDAVAAFFSEAVLSSRGDNIRFTLSPWTALVASFDASVKLASTRDSDGADTMVELSVTLDGQEQHLDQFQFECRGPCKLAEGRSLTVTVQNESDVAVGGGWWALALVEGNTAAPAAARKGGEDARARRKLNPLGLGPRLPSPMAPR